MNHLVKLCPLFTNPQPDGERYFYHSDHLGSSAYITTENGYATQFLAYMPYGETLSEQQNSTSYYSPFKFSAKEKDAETGYSYFGARYYSPELSVWLSIDPLSDKYPSLSPYNYCALNPIMLVDPDGRQFEDFISETGKLLGNDGIKDGKVYVIKTTQTAADVNNKNENPNTKFAGITNSEKDATEKFIKNNSGNTSAFQENSIAYQNSVEIEGNPDLRQGMVDIVNQDNGAGSSNSASNNREFGGNIVNGSIIPAAPCAIGNVKSGNGILTINLLSGSPSFHSHASGTYSPLPDFNSYGQEIETKVWYQSPSPADIRNAGSRTNYVFGRGNSTVYIYNSQGVQATIPQKFFVSPSSSLI